MSYSVSFITNYIKSLLESDIHLRVVEVEGEISNITYHKSGHIYFTIKDEGAVLSAVMYKTDTRTLKFRPKTGDNIIAKGRISVFNPRGSYQLITTSIREAGAGELYQRFMELKAELEEKGMFDPSYKRPIPKYIKTLGVVTSPTGAAVRDIINITRRRNPYVSVILYPALVQGEGAAFSVADGIAALNELGVDLMIVGRGGGSMEDLWAFNEEVVAEAIFSSAVPIISAVGHETDFTIADFVADLRAPTPSAGAELGVYDVSEVLNLLEGYRYRLDNSMDGAIDKKRQLALSAGRHLSALSPQRLIADKRKKLLDYFSRMNMAMDRKIERRREDMRRMAAGLSALSPANRLAQGYSYVTNGAGINIYKTDDVKTGEEIAIRVTDGMIRAEVNSIEKTRPGQ